MKLYRYLLATAVALTAVFGTCSAVDAALSPMPVYLNDYHVYPAGYLIEGNNYFKLRDIAQLLAFTECRFSVGWDAVERVISLVAYSDYEHNGSELQPATEQTATATLSNMTMLVDGREAVPTGYNIAGSTYYKLRDLGELLGFYVDYDEVNRAVYISTPSQDKDYESHGDGEWDSDLLPETETPETETPETDIPDTDEPDAPDILYPTGQQVDGELVIVLDAGHGGIDPGTHAPATHTFTLPDGTTIPGGEEVYERDLNRIVTDYLVELLEEAGATVRQTREGDETVDAETRQARIHELGYDADLLFSIHHNAAANTEASGAEVLVQIAYREGGAGMEFAQILESEYADLGRNLRKTVYRSRSDNPDLDYYYVLRAAQEVETLAIISEYCFLSNTEDQKWIQSEELLRAQAQAQCDAILSYFEDAPY